MISTEGVMGKPMALFRWVGQELKRDLDRKEVELAKAD